MHVAPLLAQFALTAPAAWAWLAAQWQSFATNAGPTLVTAIWQGAVIVCALEIATRLMGRISAAHRFALWAAGFALALALPLQLLVHFGGNSAPASASESVIAPASTHALLQLDARWGFAIAALWAVTSLIRAADLAVHSFRLRLLWKGAQPVQISESLSSSLAHLLRGRIATSRIAICTTQTLDRPGVIGFLSPRILIPDWLLPRLTPAELEQIVLHEAEHLRRRDDWTNLLQKLCLVIFPLSPALAWIEHRLCREREMACDEGVIRITNAPRAYAACLANLAERRLERDLARRAEALSLGAWNRRSELVNRVHTILLHKRTMSRTAAGALLATLGSMLIAGSIEMTRCPQLVAFVPKRNTQDITPARQIEPLELEAILARDNADPRPTLPPGYRVLPAKAVLPAANSAAPTHARRRVEPKPASQNQTNTAAPTAAQQIAKAAQSGDLLVSPEPQSQQWIVVAAWEQQVSTLNRAPQTISDYETNPSSNPAQDVPSFATAENTASLSSSPGSTNAQAQPAPIAKTQNHTPASTRQFTVTRLILRVVPANPNSSSTQPATAPVRESWFVIQL